MESPRSVRPPDGAEWLLRLLLPVRDRDAVSGDLLEAFRDDIAPHRGLRAARRWYWRQVAWFVWRAVWLPAVLIAATLLVRGAIDAFVPTVYTPGVIHPRSRIMSDVVLAIFGLSAARVAWRTGHTRAGVIVALLAAAVGGALTSIGSVLMIAIWHDPATLRNIEMSGGANEAIIGAPILMLVVGAIAGTTGAIAGRIATTLRRAIASD